MNVFEQHVLETIDTYNMIKEGQTVVAAVSGGYDSLCMLNVLCNLKRVRKFDVCVAHLNHMLRDEADADEEYVVKMAEKLGIKVYTKKVNVSEYAKEHNVSFETAGRNVRYKFLSQIASEYESAVIATAHNAQDSAESMLMHFMRGSGLTGLIGIRPVNGNVIRPLIKCDRKSIEAYCDENKIIPRHDHTNDSDDYFRNDIRHNVLQPIMQRCSVDSIVRTMNIISADDEFLTNYSTEIAKKIVVEHDEYKSISVKEFNKLHLSVKRRILRIALDLTDSDNQASLVHIDEIISMASKNYGGKQTKLPGGRVVMIKNGELII